MRQCQFRGCDRDISLLPECLTLCTDHQIQYHLFKQDVDEWIGESLEEIDYWFLFLNQGGCDGTTVSNHLTKVIEITGAMASLRRGWLKGEKKKRRWHVPFEEVQRAVSLGRNWISVKQAGLQNGITAHSFYEYAEHGLLTETRINISGALAIRKLDVPIAIAKYRKLVRAVRKFGARSSDRFIDEGEISTEHFCALLDVSGTTVRNWTIRGHIEFVVRKGCKFFKLEAFWRFVRKALNDEVRMVPKVKERCALLLAQEETLQRQAAG